MKPLVILGIAFILVLAATRVTSGNFDFHRAGRIAIAVMLIFTGIAHFIYTNGMTMMLPDIIAFRKLLVLLTGLAEIGAAAGLLTSQFATLSAWFVMLFFILVLPANIYAAYHHVDYERSNHDGVGTGYLWFRVPLQLFFIAWVYISVIL